MAAWRTKATIAVSVTLAAIFVFMQPGRDTEPSASPDIALPEDTPDVFVTGVKLVRFDANGQTELSLTGQTLALYNDRNESIITEPDVTLFTEQQANWHIVSLTATLQGSEQALFEGNVIATELAQQPATMLFSEAMAIDQNDQTLSSDLSVRILQGNHTVTAIGMTAKVDTMGSLIHLLSEVSFSYDPIVTR